MVHEHPGYKTVVRNASCKNWFCLSLLLLQTTFFNCEAMMWKFAAIFLLSAVFGSKDDFKGWTLNYFVVPFPHATETKIDRLKYRIFAMYILALLFTYFQGRRSENHTQKWCRSSISEKTGWWRQVWGKLISLYWLLVK